jgi:transposase
VAAWSAKVFSMQPIQREKIANYIKQTLQSMVIEQSEQLVVAMKMIRKLEQQVGDLCTELGAQNQQVLITAQMLDRMKDDKYGRKSEKRRGEGTLFEGDDDDADQASNNKQDKAPSKKREKFGRRAQPGLITQDVMIGIPENQCAELGLVEWEGQYEESEIITVVPSRIVLQVVKRKKYIQINAVTGERRIITAAPIPKLKEGSRYSVEFATEVALAKYQWHLPVERQVKMLSGQGLEVTSQTLMDQIDTAAWYLRPTVVRRICQYIEESPVNQADDTTWKNLQKLAERERQNFYLWGVTNDKACFFNIYDSRIKKVAKHFLGQLSGVLVSDGHASFKALASDKLVLANDWFHVRRKFVKAEKHYPEEAGFFIEKIAALNQIETKLKGKPPDEVLAKRQVWSVPIINDIRKRMDGLGHILPESSLDKALRYTDKLWDGLNVFLADGRVPIHTNDMNAYYARLPLVGKTITVPRASRQRGWRRYGTQSLKPAS